MNPQAESIKNSLLVLDQVFNQQRVSYRVLGSVLIGALNGKPHRHLGDIDILLDQRYKQAVFMQLTAAGYQLIEKEKLGFHWTEAHKSNSLGFTFLLIGKFTPHYFSYQIARFLELRISLDYLKPTQYHLSGIKFTGIPHHSVYEGLKISNFNPKRKADRRIIQNILGSRPSSGISLNQAFKVYLGNLQLPYTYPTFSYLYNLYGGLRVVLGKKYEIWD